jgi:adenosylcobinamide amidohydrolase
MRLTLSADERFLEVDFGAPQRTLSWAVVGGGFGSFQRVVWHFVRRAELTPGVDAVALLRERLAAGGYGSAVGLLTARYLRPYADRQATFGSTDARAIVTCGLGNALCVGDPPVHVEAPSAQASAPLGTINVLCRVSQPLDELGLIEALAIASEARSAAMLELRYPSVVSGKPATGTGTDCIVIACPNGALPHSYAGKHTEVGAAIGEAVYAATRRAAEVWLSEQL